MIPGDKWHLKRDIGIRRGIVKSDPILSVDDGGLHAVPFGSKCRIPDKPGLIVAAPGWQLLSKYILTKQKNDNYPNCFLHCFYFNSLTNLNPIKVNGLFISAFCLFLILAMDSFSSHDPPFTTLKLGDALTPLKSP